MQAHRNASADRRDTHVLDDDDLVIVAGAAKTPAALLADMPGAVQAMLEPFGPRRFVPWIPPASD